MSIETIEQRVEQLGYLADYYPGVPQIIDLGPVRMANFDIQIGARPEASTIISELIRLNTTGVLDPGAQAARRYQIEYATPRELERIAQTVHYPGLFPRDAVQRSLDGGVNYTYWTPSWIKKYLKK